MRAPGLATPDGTAKFVHRFDGRTAQEHYRAWNSLRVSSIGLGTYLGPPDEATDELYREAARRALDLGCNVIDTAVNYRFQRSERAIGEALTDAWSAGLERSGVIISTKGGFLPFDGRHPGDAAAWVTEKFVRRGIAAEEEIVAACHCMAPRYLTNQIETSLRNLRIEAVDIYYVHNPETQLPEVGRDEFLRRIRAAFEMLETAASEGKIGVYGVATWNGLRQSESAPDHLSLAELESAARDVAGENHRFRAVQLPVNLAMPEAIVRRNQRIGGEELSLLDAAARLGIAVMSSGSIYQGQLARGLPAAISEVFPGLASDAQRALQFARSTPGVVTALVGMKTAEHVAENLALAAKPPTSPEQFNKLFN